MKGCFATNKAANSVSRKCGYPVEPAGSSKVINSQKLLIYHHTTVVVGQFLTSIGRMHDHVE